MTVIGMDDQFPECTLMESLPHFHGGIPPDIKRGFKKKPIPFLIWPKISVSRFHHCPHAERMRIILDDDERPCALIEMVMYLVEIDQRRTGAPRFAQPSVVPMVGIGTPVCIGERSVISNRIPIRPIAPCGDRYRDGKSLGKPNTRLSLEGDPSPVVGESHLELPAGENALVRFFLFRKPLKRGKPNIKIGIHSHTIQVGRTSVKQKRK